MQPRHSHCIRKIALTVTVSWTAARCCGGWTPWPKGAGRRDLLVRAINRLSARNCDPDSEKQCQHIAEERNPNKGLSSGPGCPCPPQHYQHEPHRKPKQQPNVHYQHAVPGGPEVRHVNGATPFATPQSSGRDACIAVRKTLGRAAQMCVALHRLRLRFLGNVFEAHNTSLLAT